MIWAIAIVVVSAVWAVVWVHRRDREWREWRSIEAHRRDIERLRRLENR